MTAYFALGACLSAVAAMMARREVRLRHMLGLALPAPHARAPFQINHASGACANGRAEESHSASGASSSESACFTPRGDRAVQGQAPKTGLSVCTAIRGSSATTTVNSPGPMRASVRSTPRVWDVEPSGGGVLVDAGGDAAFSGAGQATQRLACKRGTAGTVRCSFLWLGLRGMFLSVAEADEVPMPSLPLFVSQESTAQTRWTTQGCSTEWWWRRRGTEGCCA